MLIARTSATIAIALSVGLSALAPQASAQANCAAYSRLALQQQKENITNKCGFTGPEWNDQHSRHMDWCGSVGPDQWKAQLKMRDEKLAACKKR